MKGEGIKCDNCGDIEFIPEDPTSRYGRLAFIFFDQDAEVEEEKQQSTPSRWLSVAKEIANPKTKGIDVDVKHFCSPTCLEFAVRYIYSNKELPTTNEGEK